MKAFFSALSTLTVLPVPRRFHQCDEKSLAASVVYFPVVGLFVGVLLVGLLYFLKAIFPPLVLAAVLLFVLVMLTGALHLDGVADLADGLGAGGAPERMLAVMKESQVGAFGVIALVLVLLLKFSLFFEIIDKGRWLDFVLMTLLSRWAMALAAFLGKYPRVAGTGLAFIGKISLA
ncbi:MAG: adenosylcobinamide-GDP ribazoletransferase, partial [Nitrospirae bacterium]|nr:adenosylcobinamide-GDP ribazoletransferase [Candidatus Manganitrophaceae bacterium]